MTDLLLAPIVHAPEDATILVVDDTDANRYAIVRHLQTAGYRLIEAATGTAGLDLALERAPDLVILDVRLPDVSGFEVARRLRTDDRTAAIPLLHISASFTDTRTKVQGLDNGADGYLTHPIEPAVLLATVRSLIRAREAERRAKATARAWRSTFDAIGEGVCVTNESGRIARCNRAFAEITGRQLVELLGCELTEVMPTIRRIDDAPFVAVDAAAQEGGLTHVHGRWLRSSIVSLIAEDSRARGAVCVFADVSRQRQADDRLRQSQQLEVTGRLAGGVAHEINNMMTIILGYSAFVLQRMGPGDRSRADLEEVHRAASRAADIARQLLTFSRRQPVRPVVVNLSAIVRAMERTLRQLLGADRELRLELGDEATSVFIDRAQLEQVLINLALNAKDAMPVMGTLTIRTDTVRLDEKFAARHPGLDVKDGEFVRLMVSDTGKGMSAATVAHAFEPFFTTKEVGAGTGLGLAAVYGMIKQAAGYIWVASEVGRGSEFEIYLPACGAPPTAVAAPASAVPQGFFGDATVLVVEDEPAVRALARRSLEAVGYRVLDAEDGRRALDLLSEAGAELRLIVTDVIMPRMGGPAFANEARAVRPDVPILFMSGYTDDEIAHRRLLSPEEHFVQKPFDPRTLAVRVRDLIAGASI